MSIPPLLPGPTGYPPFDTLRADLEKLDRAISSGVLTVDSHTQGRVTYRSMDEMLKARAFLSSRLADYQDAPRTRRIVVTNRSGW